MRRVFLSYRRDDSQTITGFLCEKLEDPAALGPGSVFMDIDDIPDGVDFRQVIDEAVGKCEFFLAVIGRRWVTERLNNPNDFVRLEIEAALRRNIPVTPVLVDGATMPAPADVPESLHPLLYRNARTLRPGKDFTADVRLMVERLHTAKQWIESRTAGDRRDVSPPVSPTPRKAGDRTTILLPGGVPMTFAWCPPGTFLMGSPVSEEGRSDNELQHEVTLTTGFWMGVHPVTRGQFSAFASATGYVTEAETSGGGNWFKNGSWTKDAGCIWRTPCVPQEDNHPVVVVSWNDAVGFAKWVRTTTGATLRLPTEAEWEYAARGGTTTPFYWGGELNGIQANCNGIHPYSTSAMGPYLGKTTPVGGYAEKYPHPWGLTDVIGNVFEWCSDAYDARYYQKSPKYDPVGPEPTSASVRVIRGAGWPRHAKLCRVAFRDFDAPNARNYYLGFRLAADASALSAAVS